MPKQTQVSKLYKDTAVMKVLAAISTFLDTNQGFEGTVNVSVIKLKPEDFKPTNPEEKLQRVTLENICVQALVDLNLQKKATRKVVKFYRRVQQVTLEVSEYCVTACVTITK